MASRGNFSAYLRRVVKPKQMDLECVVLSSSQARRPNDYALTAILFAGIPSGLCFSFACHPRQREARDVGAMAVRPVSTNSPAE